MYTGGGACWEDDFSSDSLLWVASGYVQVYNNIIHTGFRIIEKSCPAIIIPPFDRLTLLPKILPLPLRKHIIITSYYTLSRVVVVFVYFAMFVLRQLIFQTFPHTIYFRIELIVCMRKVRLEYTNALYWVQYYLHSLLTTQNCSI